MRGGALTKHVATPATMLAALAIAGCADGNTSTPRSQQTWVPDGAPVINLRQIRSTHVPASASAAPSNTTAASVSCAAWTALQS